MLLGGIELMHMIAKGQMQCREGSNPSAAEQFYLLAGMRAAKVLESQHRSSQRLMADGPARRCCSDI